MRAAARGLPSPRLARKAPRARGDRRGPSKLRGVRLLWEEEALDAIGAFCVAAFALGATWMLLEGAFGLSPLVSGTLAFGVALWTLGRISRHRYPERRTFAAQHAPARQRARAPGDADAGAERSPAPRPSSQGVPVPVAMVGDGSWSEAVQVALALQPGADQQEPERSGEPADAERAPIAREPVAAGVRPRTAAARRTAA